MTDADPLAIGLDNLRDIALVATGRNWRWNKYHYGTPDLVATVENKKSLRDVLLGL